MPHLHSETSTKKNTDEGFTLDLGDAPKQLPPPKKRPLAKKTSQQSTHQLSLETSSTDDKQIVERYLEEPKTVVVKISDFDEKCRCHEILKAVEGLTTLSSCQCCECRREYCGWRRG